MPETVFVLGGGANLGATQVGMLRALLEHGITPDAVVGCSVGAINGAVLAAQPTMAAVKQLEVVWSSLSSHTICPAGKFNAVRMLAKRYPTLESNDGLRHLLERHLPFRNFEETEIPLHVVATALNTGAEHWFHTGPVLRALLASSAIPAVFPPVMIDGQPYVDGAVVNNVPISRALALGARRVVVLHVGNFSRPRRAPKRPIEALIQSFSIARNHRFAIDTGSVPEGVELLVLPAVDPGSSLGYHDFSRAHMLIEKAYRLTADFLASPSHSTIGASAQSLSRS
ncbi:MAG TPA: patatin-like phospholipase family protein [Acidimicrobiales bacterium]|nr:patatin-like phospholipase family protein [Acidimicrobiales bacterium]